MRKRRQGRSKPLASASEEQKLLSLVAKTRLVNGLCRLCCFANLDLSKRRPAGGLTLTRNSLADGTRTPVHQPHGETGRGRPIVDASRIVLLGPTYGGALFSARLNIKTFVPRAWPTSAVAGVTTSGLVALMWQIENASSCHLVAGTSLWS